MSTDAAPCCLDLSPYHVRRCRNRIGVQVYLPRLHAVLMLNDVPLELIENGEPMALLGVG